MIEILKKSFPKLKVKRVDRDNLTPYRGTLSMSKAKLLLNLKSNWELEKELQFPHICDISLDFQYIGKETPTMLGKNYEGKVGANVVNRRTPPKPAETTTTTESGAN